jgi:hypothetical protein
VVFRLPLDPPARAGTDELELVVIQTFGRTARHGGASLSVPVIVECDVSIAGAPVKPRPVAAGHAGRGPEGHGALHDIRRATPRPTTAPRLPLIRSRRAPGARPEWSGWPRCASTSKPASPRRGSTVVGSA